jgi:cobalt-zinc-cadmium efflux system membrane fusion protein
MRAKQIIMLIAVALGGMLLGAAAMWWMGRMDGAATRATNEHAHEENAKTKGHDDHDGHGDHEGEEEKGESPVVRLTEAQLQELGIEVATAGPGKLAAYVTLPGHVTLNADRRGEIIPRISGAIQQVMKQLGDRVRAGEVMAVIDSRELADLKSTYLNARDRVPLAEVTFRREEDLWKKKISPEQEYLEAKRALTEARIELRAAEQKLRALGFTEADLNRLPAQADGTFTRYPITAPFDGTVIEKHVTLGAVVKDDTVAYVIADLRSVWVNVSVYTKDLALVRQGQPVSIAVGDGIPDAQGSIAYIAPVVDEQTRTALARAVLQNPNGAWRPGLFVTAMIEVGATDVPLLIPKEAVQTVEGKATVFVQTPEGFEARPVTLGRANETHVEVLSGLEAGERYAASDTFILKAELAKGEATHQH